MNCKKSCILAAVGAMGALFALASAAIALQMFEDKTNICYLMKRKAKKALKTMESKIEDKLDC